MRRLQQAGWPVGLRFDPIVYHANYREEFVALLDQVFDAIDASAIHSVSLGSFRLTRGHFRDLSRLYPDEPLFAQQMSLENGIVSYPRERERDMIDFCESELLQRIPRQSYHPCAWHD
jgi:spore photoproduct lyase